VLVDPSYSPAAFVERAREQGLTVTHILNTHGHIDHVNGNEEAVALTGAPIAGHASLPTPPGVVLAEGDTLEVGGLRLHFLHVPGHAADHLTIYESTFQILLTGDLIFVGKVGGTRSEADARTEWTSLQKVLRAIPDTATVWPGHDYGARPSSTIGLERATNPFLQCSDVDDFLRFKANWATFKKEQGLK
jgi:glyoxylase-like metal-dependent hydrolase (beta-lactamase superfamily II)